MARLSLLPACLLSLVMWVVSSAAAASPPVSGQVDGLRLLESLVVAPEFDARPYERSSFRHWVDADRDCQDTRAEVLVGEDLSDSSSGCRVTSGRWVSWLDGRTLTSARSLDVDHLVSLKEAWRSGAADWDASRREAFANDLGYEWSLAAVSASANRSKSDRDPSRWLPEPSMRCEYASRWVSVKYRWGLTVDPRERSALRGVLTSPDCAGRPLVPPDLWRVR